MFVYPPFQVINNNGMAFNMGYGWIFDSPKRGSVIANVNVPMLLIQWVGVLIVGGIAFFLAKSSPQEPRVPGSNAKNENAMSQIESETTMGSNTRLPYEWGSVVVWVLTLFLWGLTTARTSYGSEMDRSAVGLMMGIVFAVVGGLIVAAIKHFKRSPKSDSNTALASAKENDKWIFYGSLVIATFLIGKTIYLETYGALADAAILVGLGFGVKNGLGFARWLMAAYAFISAIIVVAFGSGSAVIWPFIFYAACRSIIDHRSVDVARDVDNKPIPSSARNTTSQQQSFSDSTKAASIAPGQRAVQNAPAVTKPVDAARTPLTDAKPTMNNQPPVDATPATAIESSQQSMQVIEDRLYEQIAQEIETNTVDKGIWTRLFAECGGDERQIKVLYIKQRAERLRSEIQAEMIRQRPSAERQRIIDECSTTLAQLGYRLVQKSDQWEIREPLGGRAPIISLEELTDYTRSRQIQAERIEKSRLEELQKSQEEAAYEKIIEDGRIILRRRKDATNDEM